MNLTQLQATAYVSVVKDYYLHICKTAGEGGISFGDLEKLGVTDPEEAQAIYRQQFMKSALAVGDTFVQELQEHMSQQYI
jgi:hypothetical protein